MVRHKPLDLEEQQTWNGCRFSRLSRAPMFFQDDLDITLMDLRASDRTGWIPTNCLPLRVRMD